mmetsp:Transcript_25654/g.22673  ORF Transcript_25654/g.22673 Transcript_25654/m.22673 type:complete len:81 (-) Transcript_25654:195-437(-)
MMEPMPQIFAIIFSIIKQERIRYAKGHSSVVGILSLFTSSSLGFPLLHGFINVVKALYIVSVVVCIDQFHEASQAVSNCN